MDNKRLKGKAPQIIEKVISLLDHPEEIAPAISRAIIMHKGGDKPCKKWSSRNQFIAALSGATDARGYQQWQKVGRQVEKGSTAIHILIPLTYKKTELDKSGEEVERIVTYNFGSAAVFDISQTTGDPLEDDETLQWLQNLPLQNAANMLGIDVFTFHGENEKMQGYYSRSKTKDENGEKTVANKKIALGTRSDHVWLHELTHAADEKLGNLVENGQNVISETVAQLGAEVLASILGLESDTAFTIKYIQGYCQKEKLDPATTILKVAERTQLAVEYLLDIAEQSPSAEIEQLSG